MANSFWYLGTFSSRMFRKLSTENGRLRLSMRFTPSMANDPVLFTNDRNDAHFFSMSACERNNGEE